MKKLFPVIHANDTYQVIKNAEMVKEKNADGLFLINHGNMDTGEFIQVIKTIVINFKSDNFSVGVNLLGKDNIESLRLANQLGCDLIWSDNSRTDDDSFKYCKTFCDLQDSMKPRLDFYGGVHFKYQPASKFSIEKSIKRATKYVDFPTLSGVATGVEANLGFIEKAYYAAESTPLAIASGVSIENINNYLPFIDHFLVASSLLETLGNDNFDPEKIEKLLDLVKNKS